MAAFGCDILLLEGLLVFFFLACRAAWIFCRRVSFARSRGCKPAQKKAPVRDPFIGLDFAYSSIFGKDPASHAEEAHQRFLQLGSTFIVRRWTWDTIHTCDSRNIQHVLATGFEDFSIPKLRISAMSSLLGHGIFTLNGSRWARARKVLRPSFTNTNIEPLVGVLETHFQAMLKHIMGSRSIDLQHSFFFFAMDVATEFLMGRSAGTLRQHDNGKEHQFAKDYMTCGVEVIKKMRAGPLQYLMFSAVARKAKRRMLRYVDDYLDDVFGRESDSSTVEYDVLRELSTSTRDRKALRDQALHILLASRDTTASLLSNLFFMLAKQPSAYEKMRQEVLLTVGRDPPTAAQLKSLTYLRWCVQESLRIHPVIPSNAREATKDTTLPRGGGADGSSPLFVRRGTIVVYSVHSMHRDASVFGEDVYSFRPERWDGLRAGWAYLPFNGGPRICLGQQFALLEAQYTTARMVQTFSKMKSLDDGEWEELHGLAMTCKNGVKVKLETDS